MSLGRKPKSSQFETDWQRVFFSSVGVYMQSIIVALQTDSSDHNGFAETGTSLLDKIRRLNGKNFPVIRKTEIPFDIPNHWAWCRLGEIIEFTSNLNIESKLSPETLIDYVDIDSIDNKQFKIREVKTKPVSELSSRARRVLKKGFIVYSLVRPYLNNLAIIDQDRNNFIGSTGFAVFNGILVKNEYLKFLLLTDFVRQRYLKLLSGFNSPGITHEQFTSTLVPLPPLEEQEKIVRFLNDLESDSLKNGPYFNQAIERKILSLQRSQLKGSEISTELDHQLALVKELRQAYLREAMQGKLVPQDPTDEPAEILLAKIKVEKEKLIAEKRIKRDKPLPPINPAELPFEIPSNWTWCRLGQIASIVRGGSPRPAGDKRYYEGDIPFLKVADLTANDSIFLDSHTHTIKEAGLHKTRMVGSGTLMLTNSGATLGVPKICTFQTTFNDGIAAFLEIEQLNKTFLYYFLQSRSKWFLSEASRGQGQPNLNTDIIGNTLLGLPPLAEQERIVAKLEKLMKFCDELEANIKEGITNADRLLQTALREALEPKITD